MMMLFRCCIYDLAFKPDGSELLVAVDVSVWIYNVYDGTLVVTLDGHKDLVYAVAYSCDGDIFASGSADRNVIVWTEQHEAILKYSHSDSVQCLAFSPVGCFLLSCAVTDFGLWTKTEKSVGKQRVTSRCTSCAWNSDGRIYAVALFDGTVMLRLFDVLNQVSLCREGGREIAKLTRPSGEAIWAMAFGAARVTASVALAFFLKLSVFKLKKLRIFRGYTGEILAVADCGQTIMFYDLEGKQVVLDEKKLGYDPSGMDFFNYGQYLIMCGSNRRITLYNREGTTLGTIAEMESWVWCVKSSHVSNVIAVGCVDGTLACFQLKFGAVHGLHKERYAYRENMTEVVVQHFGKQTSVKLHCNDLVKKIAIYRNKLAVQLSDRIHIYRQIMEREDGKMEYRLVEKIIGSFDCSLLVVCMQHIILCTEKFLQCYNHKGMKVRDWILDSLIKYIKVIGGPSGKETLLVGDRNGTVYKVFVDNPFPVRIVQVKHEVFCLDVSHLRTKLAVVDKRRICSVFNIYTKQLLFQEPHSDSVAWNADHDDLLCFSGDDVLNVKANDFAPSRQDIMGMVVGFSGKRAFCLNMFRVSAIEVPLSTHLYKYLSKEKFGKAYEIAAFGVTESDWDLLGTKALESFDLEIAKKAFFRVKNYKFLQLVYEIEEMKNNGENANVILGYIKAYQGQFREAACYFQKGGQEQKALEMFTELRMFDQAEDFLSSASGDTQRALMRRKADWAKSSNEPRVAAEMFMGSGDYDKALTLMIENDWFDMILSLMRRLDRSETDLLRTIGTYLVKKKEYMVAAQLFLSMNDIQSLVAMHVEAKHWNDAFALASQYPKFKEDVYLPYARYLAENDRFEEAQKAFHLAGHDEEALQVLGQLAENAVIEHRYLDAGYYNWLLGMQYLCCDLEDKEKLLKNKEKMIKAECFYAYDAINRYFLEPFASYSPEALINIARFLAFQPAIPKISRVKIFFVLAKQSRALGAFKLARFALEQLSYLKIPTRLESMIETASILIRATPFTDAEQLLLMCYKCGSTNPLVGSNFCIQCKSPFVFSFISFEILPLVEFTLADNIQLDEAMELIEAESLNEEKGTSFQQKLAKLGKKEETLSLDRDDLLSLEKSQVFMVTNPPPLKTRFYYNIVPEIAISKCNYCQHLFIS
ncbi:unnamed protein product [Enterobius vermicularis]|uniref:Intraflagellar transport protein 122 homolog n=1 Tax=Enterobius vermicularis TaxID=51028 RepID=A0A158QAE9_ENTVE|nr:unnamed protein product [Enterobius vermicularis]